MFESLEKKKRNPGKYFKFNFQKTANLGKL